MITTDDLCLRRPRGSQDDGQPPPATGSAPLYWCHEKTEAALRRLIKPRQQLARCPPQPPLALWLPLGVSAPRSRCVSIHLEVYKLWIVKTPRASTSVLKRISQRASQKLLHAHMTRHFGCFKNYRSHDIHKDSHDMPWDWGIFKHYKRFLKQWQLERWNNEMLLYIHSSEQKWVRGASRRRRKYYAR